VKLTIDSGYTEATHLATAAKLRIPYLATAGYTHLRGIVHMRGYMFPRLKMGTHCFGRSPRSRCG